ncbi:MAG TPA: UrcA family protein [Allosphingosinicella sp.]
MQFRPFILAVAAAAAGLATFTAVSPAIAADGSVVVAYEELNLNSAAGRAVLDRRIERAARQVCGTAFINELDIAAGVNACLAETIAAARRQLGEATGEHHAALRVVRAAN